MKISVNSLMKIIREEIAREGLDWSDVGGDARRWMGGIGLAKYPGPWASGHEPLVVEDDSDNDPDKDDDGYLSIGEIVGMVHNITDDIDVDDEYLSFGSLGPRDDDLEDREEAHLLPNPYNQPRDAYRGDTAKLSAKQWIERQRRKVKK